MSTYTIHSCKGAQTVKADSAAEAIMAGVRYAQTYDPMGDTTVSDEAGDVIATVVLRGDWSTPGGTVVELRDGEDVDISECDADDALVAVAAAVEAAAA